MEAGGVVGKFEKQIAQLKSALRTILQLDKSITGATESLDAGVAAAITQAFEQHAPSFKYDEESNTVDGKFKVDNAIRGVCGEIVRAAADAKQHIMEFRVEGATLPSIPQLLDVARYLSHILLGDSVLFLSLLADLVEACTIDEGTNIFLYLEKCVSYLKAHFNFEPQNAPPKLSLLRICNTLLRRLSRTRHVLLAGRIHLFLAQILPSTDRSAVNANGVVNDSHMVEIEDVPEGFLGTDGKEVNVGLYKTFWSLQQYFQNPVRATDPNLWLEVHASIKTVLAEFAKVKSTVVSAGINSSSFSGRGKPELLTVKYLSSPKLLNLQLCDAGFRRHFLVQCLVLLQACSRKSTPRQETFRIKQQGEADELQELLYKELERTPEHGRLFAKAVRSLMQHEDQWADWKATGAKSFERPKRALEVSEDPPRKRPLTQSDAVLMGTQELTRLWNLTSDNASAIKRANRKPLPSLRQFLGPVIAEMDPEDGIEEQYKKKNDPVYHWEALRQISKWSRHQLSLVLKTPDHNLEEAAQLIFPEDVPEAAKNMPSQVATLADESLLLVPPSPGPELALPAGSAGASPGTENGAKAMDVDSAPLTSKLKEDENGLMPSTAEVENAAPPVDAFANSHTADLATGEEEAGPEAESQPAKATEAIAEGKDLLKELFEQPVAENATQPKSKSVVREDAAIQNSSPRTEAS